LDKETKDEEKAVDGPAAAAPSESTARDGEDGEGDSDGDQAGGVKFTNAHQHAGEVVIRRGEVVVPEHMFLTQEEQQLLETLTYRL
jgi:hypothetical protein